MRLDTRPRLIRVLVWLWLENMIGSEIRVLIIGVLVALFLTFVGFLAGAGFAQYFPPPSLMVFLVPPALNIGLGWILVRKGDRTLGRTILYGGSIASVALPFILL